MIEYIGRYCFVQVDNATFDSFCMCKMKTMFILNVNIEHQVAESVETFAILYK